MIELFIAFAIIIVALLVLYALAMHVLPGLQPGETIIDRIISAIKKRTDKTVQPPK